MLSYVQNILHSNMNNGRRPIALADLDVSKITISKAKKHEYGQVAYVNYGDGPLRLELPSMKIPWAAGESKFDTKTPKKIEVALSFEGMDTNPELAAAYKKCQELDRRMAALIVEHRHDLYPKEVNKNVPEEEVAKRYQPLAGPPTEVNDVVYPPKIKLRFDRDKEDPSKLATLPKKALVKDANGNAIDVNADNISQVLGKAVRIKAVMDAKFLFITQAKTLGASIAWAYRIGRITSSEQEDDWDLEGDAHVGTPAPARQNNGYKDEGYLDEDDINEGLDDDEELAAAMG